MRALHRLFVLLVVLLGAWTSYCGTSNVESWNVDSYFYSGGVYYSHLHAVGWPSFMLGFREYHYATDAAGATIMPYSDVERKPQPGDRRHNCTQIYFGPFSYSIAMRALPSLLGCGFAALAALVLLDFGLKYLRGKRYETQVA